MKDEHVEVVALGGLGEFGMNTMAFRHAGTILVVDIGLMFPREDPLGVDCVIPDLAYLLDHRKEVEAVILTHGHEDHIGALPYLLKEINVPVYGTPLTLGMVRERLSEHGLLSKAQLETVGPRDTLDIGPFHVEFIRVTHSIADSLGLALETPVGTIVHTGDFKFDPSPPDLQKPDYARFSHYGEQGVLALFSDSTNSERPGYTPSEQYILGHLEQIFHTSERKIIVTCFASSVHRVQIILNLAAKFRRRVVALGRRMQGNIAIASSLGYLDVPDKVLIKTEQARSIPDEQLVILCTGSQGEPMSALARLALNKDTRFGVEPGDAIVISARAIPGNQTRISHLVNHFCRRGARVYDEGAWAVHVSGHGSQEELKLMLNLTRPKFLIPIHGEYRQLYHHRIVAQSVGMSRDQILLAETGDILRIGDSRCEIRGKAPVGKRYLDGGGMAGIDDLVVRDRKHLSQEGVVLAVVVVDQSTGNIEGVPELIGRGHIKDEEETVVFSEARERLVQAVADATAEERTDSIVLSEIIRAALKRFFRKRVATRPMIIPLVLEI